jgi:signal transduction histidine kinase
VQGEVGRLPDAVEAALYFVCSEALTNASKHARATRVTVEVTAYPARVAVVVTDDGIGGASVVGGTGLRGLADRVEALGGRFEVASPRGGGTRVVADVPLDR